MNIFREDNLKKSIIISSFTLVALLSVAFCALYISEKYFEFERDLVVIENEFIRHEKQLLKSVVDLAIKFIDYRHRQVRSEIEEVLKERVEEGAAVAENLHRTALDQHSSNEIGVMVRESLRPVRFNDNRGYYFAFTPGGEVMLYPPAPQFELKRMEEVFSPYAQEVITRMAEFATGRNQGFIEYQWPIPGENQDLPADKLAYIRYLDTLGWYIGSGDYLEHYDAMTRQKVTQELRDGLGEDLLNYFFVYRLHSLEGGKDFATMLINPNRPELVGKSLSDDYLDAKGNAFRKEFLQGIRKNGEAFVTYWYKKAGSESPEKKLSYFKLYPEWNWIVAKGVYLDELDALIAKEKSALQERVRQKILQFVLFFLLSVGVILFIAHIFTRNINEIFNKYRTTQRKQRRKLESINQILHKQATTDTLTGLFNRQYFNKELEKEISRAERYTIPLSLVLFDIDRFKRINDTMGHLHGDNVLKELSKLITAHLRQSDILARWGGEEFVLLLPELTRDKALETAEKLRALLASHSFSINQPVTCSFGVTELTGGDTPMSLLSRADKALYDAKNAGRDAIRAR